MKLIEKSPSYFHDGRSVVAEWISEAQPPHFLMKLHILPPTEVNPLMLRISPPPEIALYGVQHMYDTLWEKTSAHNVGRNGGEGGMNKGGSPCRRQSLTLPVTKFGFDALFQELELLNPSLLGP